MKRIRFTHHELDLVIRMLSIAEAQGGNWGEGDYQNWNEKLDGTALSSSTIDESFR